MMKFKYTLPERCISQTKNFSEFRNGASQATIVTESGEVFHRVLISNAKYIVAVRGFDDIPFEPNSIKEIFQTEEDKSPTEIGGWVYWDYWQ